MATIDAASELKPSSIPNTPSFPISAAHLAQLQPHTFTLAHLRPSPPGTRQPVRVNGRSRAQFRPASVNTGSLSHANGSAVVRIGDTTAVCGVRAEILYTENIASWKVTTSSSQGLQRSLKRRRTMESDDQLDDHETDTEQSGDQADDDESEIRSLNLLVPNLTLNTGCSPNISASAPPTSLAQSLSHQLLSLLHSSRLIRADDLRIWSYPDDYTKKGNVTGQGDTEMTTEGEEYAGDILEAASIKAFWSLCIDVVIISLAGNPFDAAWASVIAALRDTKLPKAWWDVDSDKIVCSNSVDEAKKLQLRGMPVASSFCVFEANSAGDWRRIFLPFEQQKGRGTKLTAQDDTGDDRDNSASPVDGEVDKWILADPDAFEESLSSERICIVVDKTRSGSKPRILRLEKNGGFYVGKGEIRDIARLAASRWDEWKTLLDN